MVFNFPRFLPVLLALAGFTGGVAWAQGFVSSPDQGVLTLSFKGKNASIPFSKVSGLFMNDRCSANLSACQAYRAYTGAKNLKFDPTDWKKFSSKAALFCKQSGGEPMILRDAKLNEVSICAFGDKTMGDSWDIYSHRNGSKS